MSSVPVLLIAGEFDTATPVELARKTVRTLENGLPVEVAKRSHRGLRGSCIEPIVDRFLETASTDGLDTGCAAESTRPPFIVN